VKVNRAGCRHALAALPFTIPDSNDLISTVTNNGIFLFPRSIYFDFSRDTAWACELRTAVNESVLATTQNLKEKLMQFKEGLLIPVVVASLMILLSDHDTSSAVTLVGVNPGEGKAKIKEGNDGVANIHDAVQDAILFYGTDAV
jgi:hypothetical protein